ncbi:MAG: methyltransferase [Bacteroidaceae bacterium]|nr:methyltransferase [Bacteroidaceae bacterium]
MPNPFFRFKQFTIRHDRSAMKVGTDGVLLGAWAETDGNSILDVGTGTGLIALMLAQRFPTATIEGIDIDEASVVQAKENVEASPFRSRIEVKKADFNNINHFSNQYDLIVSNPPFYQEETLGGNEARDAARHTVSLPFGNLVENASKLLRVEGRFCVIIPYGEATRFIALCAAKKLYLRRRLNIQSTPQKPPKRVMLDFSPTARGETSIATLTLYETMQQRTPEYTNLTKDFYL